jgi:hypothetical protein
MHAMPMHAVPTGRRPAFRSAAWAGLLLACAASSIGLTAQGQTLRLVSTAWPPFTNQPGQARFALDLVEAALGRIGVSSTATIVDAAQFTTSLLGRGPHLRGVGHGTRSLQASGEQLHAEPRPIHGYRVPLRLVRSASLGMQLETWW